MLLWRFDQPSANTCANLCPDLLKSDRNFPDSADHNGQDANEFLCMKTPLWFNHQTNRQNLLEMLFLTHYLCEVLIHWWINELITELIRGQRSWQVVCFTGHTHGWGMWHIWMRLTSHLVIRTIVKKDTSSILLLWMSLPIRQRDSLCERETLHGTGSARRPKRTGEELVSESTGDY